VVRLREELAEARRLARGLRYGGFLRQAIQSILDSPPAWLQVSPYEELLARASHRRETVSPSRPSALTI